MSSILGKVAIVTSLLVFFAGVSSFTVGAAARKAVEKSAWLAYWDLDAGVKDLKSVERKLEKLSYFGAYFDQDDKFFIPKELVAKKDECQDKKRQYETYLTFVNDKQNADGSVAVKDIEVLRRIFADDAVMEKHIDEIVALTLQGGFDGIEIDYERIWKDAAIGQSFLRFAGKLYAQALKNNLKLRIVLEPGTPFSTADFFKGPEYVVMFYNLYGLHSGPGPKANQAFIETLATRMKALPGERTAAFSTGGCVWGDNGEKRFLTEAEAKKLAVLHQREPKRDEESQCLVFSYQDKGVLYQVWYADVQTLNYWTAIVRKQAINKISLWRLGGNVDIQHMK